jgi:hypothetical protein
VEQLRVVRLLKLVIAQIINVLMLYVVERHALKMKHV